MYFKYFLFFVFIIFSSSVFAADLVKPLPSKMEGKWGRDGNKNVEISLVSMESPTKAKLDVVFSDGCVRRGEATANFNEGSWFFTAPGGKFCEDIKVTIKQLPEKNRFEGSYETLWRNSSVKGNIYLEW